MLQPALDTKISSSHKGTLQEIEILKEEKVPEINAVMTLARHRKTHAKIMHLHADDPEKLFCISFPTQPDNDHGTAHILEHTVLCGCEKYPVKDPFFYMIRRSMNTFMNAFTGSDFTCYPASSQVKQDFLNLLDVYFNSVFHPNLDHESFLQEGFRLQWKNEDELTGLLRGGVVYNEMKGAYQNPDSLLWRKTNHSLFPQGTYQYDSGGDPRSIPKITHDELKNFHKKFYHPSSALFFCYGDISFHDWCQALLQVGLNQFTQEQKTTPFVLSQKPQNGLFNKDRYPANEQNKDPLSMCGWQICEIQEQEKILQFALLDQLLMGHDGAKLKHFLIEEGFVQSCDSHLDAEMAQVPYIISFKGCLCTPHDLQSALKRRLEGILQEGFTQEEKESAIHQLKLQYLDISQRSYPLGLMLFFRAALAWQHDADPFNALCIQAHLNTLNSFIESDEGLFALIKTHLLSTDPVWTWLEPDSKLNKEYARQEEDALMQQEQGLSQEQKQLIVTLNAQLKTWQQKDQREQVELLPMLQLQDIPQKAVDYELEKSSMGDIQSYGHHCFTNMFSFNQLSLHFEPNTHIQDLLMDQSIVSIWSQLGQGNEDYMASSNKMETCCQDFYAQQHHVVDIDQNLKRYISFHVSGLKEKQPQFLELLKRHLEDKRFDENKRLVQLRDQNHQYLITHLADLGFSFARSAVTRRFNPRAQILDQLHGLPHFLYMLTLKEDSYFQAWKEQLEVRYKNIFEKAEQMDWVWTEDFGQQAAPLPPLTNSRTQNSHTQDLSDLSWINKIVNSLDQWPESFGFEIPAEVAFNAMGLKTDLSYAHEDTPLLRIACMLMQHLVLHPHIREKGGAYGSGCRIDTDRGAIVFHSYRDPNVDQTFESFKQSLLCVAQGDFDSQALHEAKLNVLQAMDSPVTPGQRAQTAHQWHLRGMSLSLRSKHRQRLLHANKTDVVRACEQLLEQIPSSACVSFASSSLLQNSRFKDCRFNYQDLQKFSVC